MVFKNSPRQVFFNLARFVITLNINCYLCLQLGQIDVNKLKYRIIEQPNSYGLRTHLKYQESRNQMELDAQARLCSGKTLVETLVLKCHLLLRCASISSRILAILLTAGASTNTSTFQFIHYFRLVQMYKPKHTLLFETILFQSQ